jgi:hypothetical protein
MGKVSNIAFLKQPIYWIGVAIMLAIDICGWEFDKRVHVPGGNWPEWIAIIVGALICGRLSGEAIKRSRRQT